MARYQLQNRYQDSSSWEELPEESFDNRKDAVKRADKLSKDAIIYGMVRVVDTMNDSVVITFSAGHD